MVAQLNGPATLVMLRREAEPRACKKSGSPSFFDTPSPKALAASPCMLQKRRPKAISAPKAGDPQARGWYPEIGLNWLNHFHPSLEL